MTLMNDIVAASNLRVKAERAAKRAATIAAKKEEQAEKLRREEFWAAERLKRAARLPGVDCFAAQPTYSRDISSYAACKARLVAGLRLSVCTNFMMSRGTVYTVQLNANMEAVIVSTASWWSTVYSDSDTSRAGEFLGIAGIVRNNDCGGYHLGVDLGGSGFPLPEGNG